MIVEHIKLEEDLELEIKGKYTPRVKGYISTPERSTPDEPADFILVNYCFLKGNETMLQEYIKDNSINFNKFIEDRIYEKYGT